MSPSVRSPSLRIIAGSARGRRLRCLPGNEVRPTLDRIREAIFSSLGQSVEGALFLDLFAGTGAVGIEALSRGARSATFVESSRRCNRVLHQNLEHCGLTERASVLRADWKTAVRQLRRSHGPFDVAYVDPPYDRYREGPILNAVAALLAPQGQLLLEHGVHKLPPGNAGELMCARTVRYGQTAISWYAPPEGCR